MGSIAALALQNVAPVFLVLSPLISYSDQIYSIHRSKNSAGFSLDIPLIMLVASIFKVFYWFGAYYAYSLFLQALFTIFVQVILLKVALENRPPAGVRAGVEHMPFSGHESSSEFSRPYGFWQWRATRPYWSFLAYMSLTLLVIHALVPPIAQSELYIALLGLVGLGVESLLPIPQILSNKRSQSCRGFRLSVLASWLVGDTTKMSYFFLGSDPVPTSFKLCGLMQFACDCYLGVQYWIYGDGVPAVPEPEKQGSPAWGMKEEDTHLS